MKRLLYLLLLVTAFWWTVEPGVVTAHGGGTLQINNAPVGECLVSVWSAPPTAQAHTPVHITVGVAAAADGAPILDADVQVTVTEGGRGTAVAQAAATTDQSVNRLFYEADIPPLPAGTYQFVVTTGCQGVTEAVPFEVLVRPSANLLLRALPLAGGGLLLVILAYHRWRQRHKAGEPVRNHRPGRY